MYAVLVCIHKGYGECDLLHQIKKRMIQNCIINKVGLYINVIYTHILYVAYLQNFSLSTWNNDNWQNSLKFPIIIIIGSFIDEHEIVFTGFTVCYGHLHEALESVILITYSVCLQTA